MAGLVGARRRRRRTTTPTSRATAARRRAVRLDRGLDDLLATSDVIVVLAAHRAVDWDHVYGAADLVVDTVNNVRGRDVRPRQVLRLGAGWAIPAATVEPARAAVSPA